MIHCDSAHQHWRELEQWTELGCWSGWYCKQPIMVRVFVPVTDSMAVPISVNSIPLNGTHICIHSWPPHLRMSHQNGRKLKPFGIMTDGLRLPAIESVCIYVFAWRIHVTWMVPAHRCEIPVERTVVRLWVQFMRVKLALVWCIKSVSRSYFGLLGRSSVLWHKDSPAGFPELLDSTVGFRDPGSTTKWNREFFHRSIISGSHQVLVCPKCNMPASKNPRWKEHTCADPSGQSYLCLSSFQFLY